MLFCGFYRILLNEVYRAGKFNGYVPVFLVFAERLSRKNVSVEMSKVFETWIFEFVGCNYSVIEIFLVYFFVGAAHAEPGT